MSDPKSHRNLHPSFFVSSKWFLSDFLQYSAGFHVVLIISGNCFFKGQLTGYLLTYQGQETHWGSLCVGLPERVISLLVAGAKIAWVVASIVDA
jgi:hypothetical protein